MNLAMKDKLAEYEDSQKEDKARNQAQNKPKYNDDKGHRDKSDDEDDDFMDADEKEIFEKMKQDRLRELKEKQISHQKDDDDEYEEKGKNKTIWSGEYTEIVEQEFLPYVTKADFSAVHFYHKDFERCKIIDKHLQIISPQHKECKFLKLDAEKAPFFITKLAVKTLPTICLFKNGVLVDQVVGFEELGGKDDFKTMALIRRYTINIMLYRLI